MEKLDIKFYDIEELGIWPVLPTVEVSEGELRLSQHLSRERNSKIVKLAKKRFKENHDGKLFCEICDFSFIDKYGDIGDGFIEAHHIKPVSQMEAGCKTKIIDFIMVCSNCHSMLHYNNGCILPDELKTKIR